MAVMIRLARQGGTNDPIFSVVVMSKASKRDGKFLERLGQYLPKAKTAKEKLKIDLESYQAWMKKGAVPTETVRQAVTALSK